TLWAAHLVREGLARRRKPRNEVREAPVVRVATGFGARLAPDETPVARPERPSRWRGPRCLLAHRTRRAVTSGNCPSRTSRARAAPSASPRRPRCPPPPSGLTDLTVPPPR